MIDLNIKCGNVVVYLLVDVGGSCTLMATCFEKCKGYLMAHILRCTFLALRKQSPCVFCFGFVSVVSDMNVVFAFSVYPFDPDPTFQFCILPEAGNPRFSKAFCWEKTCGNILHTSGRARGLKFPPISFIFSVLESVIKPTTPSNELGLIKPFRWVSLFHNLYWSFYHFEVNITSFKAFHRAFSV